jgi:hypothetical protein
VGGLGKNQGVAKKQYQTHLTHELKTAIYLQTGLFGLPIALAIPAI